MARNEPFRDNFEHALNDKYEIESKVYKLRYSSHFSAILAVDVGVKCELCWGAEDDDKHDDLKGGGGY